MIFKDTLSYIEIIIQRKSIARLLCRDLDINKNILAIIIALLANNKKMINLPHVSFSLYSSSYSYIHLDALLRCAGLGIPNS